MNSERDASYDKTGQSSSAVPGKLDRLFRKLIILIPVGIIGNIIFCLGTSDHEVLASVVRFTPGYLVLAALLSVVPWFTGSLRLFFWSRFLGQPLRYPDAFRIAITADLGAAITPPLIGGSAVKIGMLMSRGFSAGTALSLPALENMEDGLFFLIMVPLALTISSSWDLPQLTGIIHFDNWTWLPAIGIAALAFGILFLLLARRWKGLNRLAGLEKLREKIESTYRNFLLSFRMIGRNGKKVLIMTMTLTAVQWICRYSIISLLLASIDIPVRPVLFMVLQVVVFGLMALVPSPGGAGGAEIIFSLLYKPFLPEGTIGIVTTGWRFFTFYFHILLAALLFLLLGVPVWKERRSSDLVGHKKARQFLAEV